jgi:hypothetical protein
VAGLLSVHSDRRRALSSFPATVTITITSVPDPPDCKTENVYADRGFNGMGGWYPFTLNGYDPEGGNISFRITQSSGVEYTGFNTTTGQLSYRAPGAYGQQVINYVVSNGALTSRECSLRINLQDAATIPNPATSACSAILPGVMTFPSAIYFGPSPINSGPVRQVRILNGTNAPMVIGSISNESSATAFTVEGVTFPFTLAANAETTVSVRYSPTSAAYHYTTFGVRDSGGILRGTFNVGGLGVSSMPIIPINTCQTILGDISNRYFRIDSNLVSNRTCLNFTGNVSNVVIEGGGKILTYGANPGAFSGGSFGISMLSASHVVIQGLTLQQSDRAKSNSVGIYITGSASMLGLKGNTFKVAAAANSQAVRVMYSTGGVFMDSNIFESQVKTWSADQPDLTAAVFVNLFAQNASMPSRGLYFTHNQVKGGGAGLTVSGDALQIASNTFTNGFEGGTLPYYNQSVILVKGFVERAVVGNVMTPARGGGILAVNAEGLLALWNSIRIKNRQDASGACPLSYELEKVWGIGIAPWDNPGTSNSSKIYKANIIGNNIQFDSGVCSASGLMFNYPIGYPLQAGACYNSLTGTAAGNGTAVAIRNFSRNVRSFANAISATTAFYFGAAASHLVSESDRINRVIGGDPAINRTIRFKDGAGGVPPSIDNYFLGSSFLQNAGFDDHNLDILTNRASEQGYNVLWKVTVNVKDAQTNQLIPNARVYSMLPNGSLVGTYFGSTGAVPGVLEAIYSAVSSPTSGFTEASPIDQGANLMVWAPGYVPVTKLVPITATQAIDFKLKKVGQ